MRTTALMACASALAWSAVIVPASAEDGKTFSGSACQATFASGVQSLFRNGQQLLSSGSGAVSVTCPVTKDLEAGRIKRAQVFVIDRNPNSGGEVRCTLATFSNAGTQVSSEVRASTGSDPTRVQTLTFGAQLKANAGSYSLSCEFPPFVTSFGPSSLVMYNVVEE